MPYSALVTFDENIDKRRPCFLAKSGILELYPGTALLCRIYRKRIESGVKVVLPDTDAEFLSIGLPFTQASLISLNKQYLARCISSICSENGCTRCFFPPAANWSDGFKQYAVDTGTRPIVFKALLMPILNEICTRGGLRLDGLDITFVCGDNISGLPEMIGQLEPFIKYMNIATPAREVVERGLAEISRESGLSIFVSGDFNSILKTADFIINMGCTDAISKYRIKPQTLFINFGGDGCPVPQGEYPIINGVEYAFAEKQYAALGKDILRSYTRAGLAEILMALKAGLSDTSEYTDAVSAAVTGIYKSCGCRITGFKGRRGILEPEDVLKSLGLRF